MLSNLFLEVTVCKSLNARLPVAVRGSKAAVLKPSILTSTHSKLLVREDQLNKTPACY